MQPLITSPQRALLLALLAGGTKRVADVDQLYRAAADTAYPCHGALRRMHRAGLVRITRRPSEPNTVHMTAAGRMALQQAHAEYSWMLEVLNEGASLRAVPKNGTEEP